MRLIVVKVLTDQDGLYGYGCGTFTQRADLVNAAVEKYLKPFLIGKPADRIDDIWQAMYNSSYWRNGPVLNNAISGVDQALWDIKGRQANMPVYQLLGGKMPRGCRLLRVMRAAREIPRCIDQAQKLMAQGFRHVRVQVGVPGMAGYGSGGAATAKVPRCTHGPRVRARRVVSRRALKLFEECRKTARRRCRVAARHARALTRRIWPCSSPRMSSSSSCSSSKTRSRRKTSRTSARSASSARRRSPWASCSTARTNGRR